MAATDRTEPLGASAKRVLDFVREFRGREGRAPTNAEGARALGWNQPWAFGHHVAKLVEAGALVRETRGTHRDLREPDEPRPWSVPLGGYVCAGEGVENLDGEVTRLHMHELFPYPDAFALKVRGKSMIDAHIAPGDIVILRPDTDPATGEKVVVRTRSGLALKTLQRVNGAVWLYPCNRRMKPREVKAGDGAEIVGVLVGVIRAEGKR